ncbi:hypothetical protein KDW_49490 [Dictyobacter vulcani]|uniref:Uncharacterized protein n=1 Tax=Dictyobacter vulcani TaxID=2607529 RepID=A0A5J4KW78_9CHLR|nr:hypothetical protein KDW_49490 [Dictyobacter vulcani]
MGNADPKGSRDLEPRERKPQALGRPVLFGAVWRLALDSFEGWLEEVFQAASEHGREKELMEGYQERMRQELSRDPYKGIEVQYRSYVIEWKQKRGGESCVGKRGRFEEMQESMSRYGLVSYSRCDWTRHHCAWSQGV